MASSRQLARLRLDPDIQSRLLNRHIVTAKDLYSKTVIDLSELLDLSIDQVLQLLQDVAKSILPDPVTALDLYRQAISSPRYLRTMLPPLDTALLGGIPAGSITEIVGPAGLGKTQFCLAMCIVGCMDRLREEGRVLYIDTERKFSAERLAQIAKERFPQNFATPESISTMLDRVLIKSPDTSTKLLELLQGLQSDIIDHGIKLVIIDSIASLARSDFGATSIVERQQILGKQASSLKYLAESFRIPVLVTNQVTTFISNSANNTNTNATNNATNNMMRNDTKLVAALGPMWAHAVNTRLVMSAEKINSGMNEQQLRVLTVAKSPAAPRMSMAYHVTTSGIEWIDDVDIPESVLQQQSGSVVEMIISNYQAYADE